LANRFQEAAGNLEIIWQGIPRKASVLLIETTTSNFKGLGSSEALVE
jgi:hypothetical protein